LHLDSLAYLSDWFQPGRYVRWKGESQRTVGWLAGCFILARADLLKRLGGFDEQFFYYYEDMDLCRRAWQAAYSIVFTPDVSITHLGGQSTSKRFPPIGFALDGQVTRYLYFYKHHGKRGARQARTVVLVSLALRRIGLGLIQLARPSESRKARLEQLQVLYAWNSRVDPVRLVEQGEEPDLGIDTSARVMER
jgi:GT2 family glycosyltransferase